MSLFIAGYQNIRDVFGTKTALKVSDVPEKALKWRLFPEFGLSCVFVTNVISIFCLASWHYFGTKIIPKILSAILVPKNRLNRSFLWSGFGPESKGEDTKKRLCRN